VLRVGRSDVPGSRCTAHSSDRRIRMGSACTHVPSLQAASRRTTWSGSEARYRRWETPGGLSAGDVAFTPRMIYRRFGTGPSAREAPFGALSPRGGLSDRMRHFARFTVDASVSGAVSRRRATVLPRLEQARVLSRLDGPVEFACPLLGWLERRRRQSIGANACFCCWNRPGRVGSPQARPGFDEGSCSLRDSTPTSGQLEEFRSLLRPMIRACERCRLVCLRGTLLKSRRRVPSSVGKDSRRNVSYEVPD
jgi:hypothetical protein